VTPNALPAFDDALGRCIKRVSLNAGTDYRRT